MLGDPSQADSVIKKREAAIRHGTDEAHQFENWNSAVVLATPGTERKRMTGRKLRLQTRKGRNPYCLGTGLCRLLSRYQETAVASEVAVKATVEASAAVETVPAASEKSAA